MSFASFIKKQTDKNGPQGDFARDHAWILERSSHFSQHPNIKNTDTVESDTLLGHYNFLPVQAQNDDRVIEALCSLWREWITYKHIGLRYDEPAFGYVYFFNLIAKPSIYKVGRTSIPPYEYLRSVESREKAKFEIFSWMKIKNYDLIEKELHAAFQKNRMAREFFELSKEEIYAAISIYKLTDEHCELFPDDYFEDDELMDWIRANYPISDWRVPTMWDFYRDYNVEV